MNERALHALKGWTEPASARLQTPPPRKTEAFPPESVEILDECSASVSASVSAAAAPVEPQTEEVSEEPAPWRVQMLP